ncbi:hypothetical protein LINPERHAP2_LOCUS3337, partial [Linum perenne]
GSVAAGGVVWEDRGNYLAAFSANLERCSITRAELRGIIVGFECGLGGSNLTGSNLVRFKGGYFSH